jgi:putative Ca2+/H+ antiporter (TMEM165/GDT1 family)
MISVFQEMLHSVMFQTVILVGAAELFDKTFFITMLLAMKHKEFMAAVFTGCFAALVAHVGLAAVLGYGMSKVISTRTLEFAAAALYFLFALMYANDWRNASDDSLGALEEAQESLEESQAELKPLKGSMAHTGKRVWRESMRILTLGFTSTFIAEFGDRTQFAMIGQHASQPIIPVCIGSTIAFFLICGVAVACGACLSNMAVSERTVAMIGGLSFLLFAIVSLYDATHGTSHSPRDVVTGAFLQGAFGIKHAH